MITKEQLKNLQFSMKSDDPIEDDINRAIVKEMLLLKKEVTIHYQNASVNTVSRLESKYKNLGYNFSIDKERKTLVIS
jgi:hypothetical protein